LADLRRLVLTRPAVFTKNIASCDFFLADLRRLVLTRPSGPGAVALCALRNPWGAAHVPRAGVADKRRQEIGSRALHGSCKPEPTPGRRRRRESRQPERSQHRV